MKAQIRKDSSEKVTSAQFLRAMVALYAKRDPRRVANGALKASIAQVLKAKEAVN